MTGFTNRLLRLRAAWAAILIATLALSPGSFGPAFAKGKTYTVQEGDNLWTVARKFDTHIKDIVQLNRLDATRHLKPGMTIELPPDARFVGLAHKPVAKRSIAGATYTVRDGDSPWLIARRFDIHTTDLLAANDLELNRPLQPGQQLIIPNGQVAQRAKAAPKKVKTILARRPHIKPGGYAFVIDRRAAIYAKSDTRSEKVRIVEHGKQLNVVGRKDGWLKLQLSAGEIAWMPAKSARVQVLYADQPVQGTPKAIAGDEPAKPQPAKSASVDEEEARAMQQLAEAIGNDPEATTNIEATSQLIASLPPDKPSPATKPLPGANGKYASQGLKYLGTRYRRGGLSSRGMDCSGLVTRVLRDYGKSVPHNAAALFGMGIAIARGQLQPGDLVFFKNTYKRGVSHVGIFIGKNKFVHASSRGRRVTTTSLSEPYYVNHWAGARRVR